MPIVQILRNDFSLGGTVTSTNEEPGAPAKLVLTYQHSERWKTLNLTTMRLTLDAGEPKPFDAVFFGYHNGTGSGAFKVRASNTLGTLFTSPTYDPAADPLRYLHIGEFISYHSLHTAVTTQTFRYIGIEITDNANPDGFIAAGILYVGNWFTPKLESNVDSEWNHDDFSIITEMVNGESVARRRRRPMVGKESWSGLNEVDAQTFRGISRTYGKSTPIVVRVVPGISTYGMNNLCYCLVTGYRGPVGVAPIGFSPADPVETAFGPRFNVELSFKEV